MTYYVKSNISAEIILETDDLAEAKQRVSDEGAMEMIVDGVSKVWRRAYIDTVKQRKWTMREDDSGNLIVLKAH